MRPERSHPFVAEPGVLRVCDSLAKRYGCMPHEVLHLDPFEVAFDLACHDQGRADEQTMAAASKAWPVIDVGR